MKRLFLMVCAIIAIFALTMTVIAQDESPSENACYAGGDMEGKCDWPTEAETDWAWNCGWYYAAIQSAKIGAGEFPETCGGKLEVDCIAVNDEFENNPGEPGYIVLPPGVLANDLNCSEVVSFTKPIVTEGGSIVSFTMFVDGGFEYEVTDPETIFTFTYTTESGSTATVTVYHDIDCGGCGR